MRRGLYAALCTTALLLGGTSIAQGSGSSEAAAVQKAREHFDRGGELYKLALYEEAIAEFKAAYSARPHPAIFYNLGQCYEKLGRLPDAIENYRRYLDESPKAPDRERVIVVIHNLEERVAREQREAEAAAKTPAQPVPPAALETTKTSGGTFDLTKKRPFTWVALGAGALATGTAIYFGVSSAADSRKLRGSLHTAPGEAEALKQSAIRNAQTANVFYAVGGAFGAAGVGLFFYEGRF